MAKSDERRKPTPEAIKKRYEAADRKWDEWRNVYDLCYTYAAPQRNLFGGQFDANVQGGTKMNLVFDSTAISSLDRFANRIQSNVFPPQSQYSRLEPGTDIPEERKAEVQKALELIDEKKTAVQRSSNFDIAIGEFLHDLGIGTAHMCIQPGDAVDPINYTAVSPALVRFEEDEYGKPCNHYRQLKVKAELITKLWKGAKLDDTLATLVKDKPTEEVELLESTTRDLETDRYHYQIFFKDHEVYWRSQKYSNWVTARYSKLAGEILGRGPVVSALPDIRTLNKVKELVLKNAAIAVSGMWTVRDDGVINPNNVKVGPGVVLGVASNAGPQGPSIAALKSGGDFNVAQLVINDLVMSIKRILLDESLPPDTASARSATEIIERMKELAQNMGSAFGRLIDEAMLPIDEITLMVLNDRGIINLPLRLNGREIKAVPVAPLAMAQHMDKVESIFNYANMMALLGPEGAVALNKGPTIEYVGDAMGIPAKIRNTPEERAAEMDTQQKQALAASVMQTGMDAMAKGKQPPPDAAPMGMMKQAA
jgi:hypothetical protein